MSTELEIKAPALPTESLEPEDVFAALAGRVELRSPATRTHLDACYHDDARLRSAGWTLRARCEDDRIVATTKGPGQLRAGVRERIEINAPIEHLPEVGDPLPAPIAAAYVEHGLPLSRWPEQAYRSVVQRTKADLQLPGCVAELAIDHGHVAAGGRESPVRELELELVEGDASALLDAAMMLAAHLGLRPGGFSKAARGMALTGRLRDPSLPASPTLLDRWEQLVDLEDRLRLGEEQWTEPRRAAIEELIEQGAPKSLRTDAGDPDAARQRIDAPEHAALLWGLFVAATRAGQ